MILEYPLLFEVIPLCGTVVFSNVSYEGRRSRTEFHQVRCSQGISQLLYSHYNIISRPTTATIIVTIIIITNTQQYARFLRKLVGHKRSVSCAESTKDGHHVWSGDSEGNIRVWSVEDLKFVREIPAPTTARFFSIKRVGQNMWCATERSLYIRDQDGQLLHESLGATFSVLAIDNTVVWTGCDCKIKIWDARVRIKLLLLFLDCVWEPY